jgi:hypothetical protein
MTHDNLDKQSQTTEQNNLQRNNPAKIDKSLEAQV